MIPESMVRVERVNVFHEYLRRTILPSAIIIIEISIPNVAPQSQTSHGKRCKSQRAKSSLLQKHFSPARIAPKLKAQEGQGPTLHLNIP